MNITYEYWKSRIENGDFILVDDDKYDDFTKIYEKETEICFKKEDIVEKELHVFDPSDDVVEEVVEVVEEVEEEVEEDDILEDKRSRYITFIVWFLALCAVAGITLNATFHDSSEQVDTKIIEKYDAIDIAWLIL